MSSSSSVVPQPIPQSSASESAPAVDSLAKARRTTTSPPIDPSKLNNQLAPLPAAEHPLTADPLSPPLRSPPSAEHSSGGGSDAPLDSAYLEGGMLVEPASHPTIAETGTLASSPQGTGPKQGQLKRAEKNDGGIIKLGSLGGEGLKVKPPVGLEHDQHKEADSL